MDIADCRMIFPVVAHDIIGNKKAKENYVEKYSMWHREKIQ